MGLNVTVSKGHDFTTGNVTRAALNAGATPTIAVTGSVGESEIASGAITNAKVKTNADIDVAKLALASGKIIIGAANGNASALSGTSSFSSVASETEGNAGLLVDVGDKFEVLKTNTLAVSTDDINDSKQYLNGDSALSIHKVTTDGVTTNNLRIKHITNSIHGNHISTANALDGASIGKNNSGKLEVKDGGIHHQKLYPYKNSSGDARSGFLTYGSGGAAKVVEATTASQILITGGSNNDLGTKVFQKELDFGQFLTTGSNWKRIEHGLGTVPMSAEMYLQCTAFHSDHGYAVGDRLWLGSQLRPYEGLSWAADNKYVYVYNHLGSATFFRKCGGNSTAANSTDGTHQGNVETGSNSLTFDLDQQNGNFAVRVRVTG